MSSQLQAYALNRIIACNGSISMVAGAEIPADNNQTVDQLEGDAVHYMSMDVLRGIIRDPIEYVDRKMPNGIYITADMVDFVDPFVQSVLTDPGQKWIETAMDFDLSAETRILCRPDAITFNQTTGQLHVRDLKYGFRIVEPFDNWTMVAYAMTWIINTQIVPTEILLSIYQPRPHHEDGKIRTLRLTYPELLALYQQMVEKLATITDDLHTGPHCYKCPSLAHCVPARNAMYNGIEAFGKVFVDRVPDDELFYLISVGERAIDAMEQRVKAMKELAMHRLSNGNVSQEWGIERTFGHRKFKPFVTVAMIKTLSGIDISKDGMLTPAQAEKAGVPEAIINTLVDRPPLAPKLVKKSATKRADKLFNKPNQ